MVKATLAVQKAVGETFRKTAANFHYEFNVRHLASVFEGLLVSQPENFEGDGAVSKFTQLWLHEADRIYGDRLVSLEHVARYNGVALV